MLNLSSCLHMKKYIFFFLSINIEYVQPSTWTEFSNLALCVSQFDTPDLDVPALWHVSLIVEAKQTLLEYVKQTTCKHTNTASKTRVKASES